MQERIINLFSGGYGIFNNSAQIIDAIYKYGGNVKIVMGVDRYVIKPENIKFKVVNREVFYNED